MAKTKPQWLTTSAVCVMLLLVAGCETPMQKDVGLVVVPPKVQLPPVPAIVQSTLPKEPGYFLSNYLNYFKGSDGKATK